MRYAFINAAVLDGSKDMEAQRGMTVLVEGEKIKEVRQGGRVPDGWTVIDLKGKYLLPGLINMHAHMFGTGKPAKSLGGGFQQRLKIGILSTALGKKILDKMVLADAQMALYSGTTTVRCVGDFHYSDVHARDKINSGKAAGPRMLVSGPALTVSHGHGDGTFALTADDPAALRQLTEGIICHRVDLIKLCITGGVMDSTVKGQAGILRMSYDEAKAICDAAHAAGLIVASHTECTEGVRTALKAGVDSIEHGAAMDREIIDLYHQRHAFVTCTISPAIPMAKLDPSVSLMSEVCQYNSNVILEGVIKSARQAVENDIPLALGTDAACPFAMQYNMWRELAYLVKYVGVTNKFALWSATANNARLAGLGKVTGTIKAGFDADLIVCADDPLQDLRALSRVEMVMARGKLTTDPDPHRMPEVEEELDKLL